MLRTETQRVVSQVAQLKEGAETLERSDWKKGEMATKLLTELERVVVVFSESHGLFCNLVGLSWLHNIPLYLNCLCHTR